MVPSRSLPCRAGCSQVPNGTFRCRAHVAVRTQCACGAYRAECAHSAVCSSDPRGIICTGSA